MDSYPHWFQYNGNLTPTSVWNCLKIGYPQIHWLIFIFCTSIFTILSHGVSRWLPILLPRLVRTSAFQSAVAWTSLQGELVWKSPRASLEPMAVRHRDRTWQCHWKLWVTPGSGLTHRMYSLQFFFWATRHGRFKKHMLMQASWFALALGKWIFPSSTLLKLTTRYTPHRRPRRFGHFLQLALTFVHQHFLQGTSVYLRFVPFFNVSGDVAVQWRTELVTWVLGAVAKPIETRVPKLLEKEQCATTCAPYKER